jgi:NAD(P)H dehydrogenase (quinone)
MGRTYGGDRRYANGAFRSKRAMLSTPGPVPSYVKSGINGDIQAILRPAQRGILASICCLK